MGTYLNPGNKGFERILKTDYIDKTGLISLINERIDTENGLICISRPRRFGKSYAAKMLCAYYDCSCDSHSLFEKYEISKTHSYEDHMNRYQVIYLDMTQILCETSSSEFVSFIKTKIIQELKDSYPDLCIPSDFSTTLINAVEYTGKKFVVVIDEWDAPLRESEVDYKEYMMFLRMLFKSSATTHKIFAAAYMTGILPIKKDGSQSAISDFKEFSILEPGPFAKYTGFLEGDVKKICDKYHCDFQKMKKWYDGYTVGDEVSVYNPYSVISAAVSGKFKSYWRQTSAADDLLNYIEMDEEGLQGDIAQLIAGETIEIDSGSFNNDITGFKVKDDVLTLLVHLGYLGYEQRVEILGEGDDEDELIREFVYIPNEEVRLEFKNILKLAKHEVLVDLLSHSKKLLQDTVNGNEEAVAKAIDEVRQMNYAPTYYNDEQALRYVIKFAYIVCVDHYMKIEELPSGKGIADVVFVPRKATDPTLVIELKWNQSETAAIQQIKDRNYPAILKNRKGKIILVGINYDEKTKVHTCKIDTVTK